MAGTRLTNTFEEGLQKLFRQISDLKLMEGADLEWLINLETMVIERIQQPAQDQFQAGMGELGMQPQFPPMPDMGGVPGPPGGTMGGMIGADPISQNPDELRRLMG